MSSNKTKTLFAISIPLGLTAIALSLFYSTNPDAQKNHGLTDSYGTEIPNYPSMMGLTLGEPISVRDAFKRLTPYALTGVFDTKKSSDHEVMTTKITSRTVIHQNNSSATSSISADLLLTAEFEKPIVAAVTQHYHFMDRAECLTTFENAKLVTEEAYAPFYGGSSPSDSFDSQSHYYESDRRNDTIFTYPICLKDAKGTYSFNVTMKYAPSELKKMSSHKSNRAITQTMQLRMLPKNKVNIPVQ